MVTMKNPNKSCYCKLAKVPTPDPAMEVRTIGLVCGHGYTDPAPAVEFFGHPTQLIHLVTTVVGLWGDGEEIGKEPHVFGYVVNDGDPDEVHIWKFADYEPQIGWDVCRLGDDSGQKLLAPHQGNSVQNWAVEIATDLMEKGLGLVD